jgi:hypothetical protein
MTFVPFCGPMRSSVESVRELEVNHLRDSRAGYAHCRIGCGCISHLDLVDRDIVSQALVSPLFLFIDEGQG